jgi:hypothetical protein
MATGALNAQGVWIYGEDDSNTTFSALLNRLGTSISTNMKGRIVQIVTGSTTATATNTTTTPVATNLTATITPTSASSKILILVSQNGVGKQFNITSVQFWLRRGGTNLAALTHILASNGSSAESWPGTVSTNFLDSPATTSATTYSTVFANRTGAGTVYSQAFGLETSTITLMEISQ